MKQINGSCLCGKIKFEIQGEFEMFFLCHCQHCQKDTGSAHAANLFSSTAQISWKSGKELVKTYNLPNTRHTKSFCSDCGSAMPNVQNSGSHLVVPAGCLDNSFSIKPTAHIFMKSKADWETDFEQVKKFDQFPE